MQGISCVIIGLIAVLFGLVIWPFILMFAWNAVMPTVFGLPMINFIQAFALNLVFWILTSGARAIVSRDGK